MESIDKEKNALSLPVLLSLIAGFFTLSGGLWHLGYWSTFQFNYFEYANLTDLFKSSFYLFFGKIWPVVGLLLFVSAAFYFNLNSFKKEVNKIDNDPQAELTIGEGKNKSWVLDFIIGLVLLFIGTFTSLTHNETAFVFFPFLISLALLIQLVRISFLKGVIKNESARILFIFFFVVYPVSNFFVGKSTAKKIINGSFASIITDFDSQNKTLDTILLGKPYLGSSSDFHFIYIFSGQIGVIDKKIVHNYILMNLYDYKNQVQPIIDHNQRLKKNHQNKVVVDSTTTTIDTTSKK